MTRFAVLWVVGLLTAVPYAIYHLLFHAPRDQYAGLITFVLFWIFGYWGLVVPIMGALRARRLLKAIEQARSSEELRKVIQGDESEEAVIDLIASENRIPRFIARRLYHWVAKRLSTAAPASRPG